MGGSLEKDIQETDNFLVCQKQVVLFFCLFFSNFSLSLRLSGWDGSFSFFAKVNGLDWMQKVLNWLKLQTYNLGKVLNVNNVIFIHLICKLGFVYQAI